MKKHLLLLFALALISGSYLKAQNINRCGTMEYLAAQKAADPDLAARMAEIENQTQKWIAENGNQKTSMVITIPVVVHVLYNIACSFAFAPSNFNPHNLTQFAFDTFIIVVIAFTIHPLQMVM